MRVRGVGIFTADATVLEEGEVVQGKEEVVIEG